MLEKDLLDTLTHLEKEMYYKEKIVKTVEKGALINRESCLGLISIVKGRLRVYLSSEGGREVTLFTLVDNSICIMSSPCSFGASHMNILIEASLDTTFTLLPHSVMDNLIDSNITFNSLLLKLMSSRMTDILTTMDSLLTKPIDSRLASYLTSNNQTLHTITHQELGNLIGSPREVVSRTLKKLENSKLISLGRKKIEVLDLEKLKNLI